MFTLGPRRARSALLRPLTTTSSQPSRKVFENESEVDGIDAITTHFQQISTEPFSKESQAVLAAPCNPADIETKPDGIVYLPEIKYRRILIKAFGAGGWGMVPRGPHTLLSKTLSREYALFVNGRFISQARGEQDIFGDNLATASEGVKSNALMRCCKDLGVASELWDPTFLAKFRGEHLKHLFVTHQATGQKKMIWLRKDRNVEYPYKL